jgi:hypothetical protein
VGTRDRCPRQRFKSEEEGNILTPDGWIMIFNQPAP